MARGEIIWIAESDDWAETTFLEKHKNIISIESISSLYQTFLLIYNKFSQFNNITQLIIFVILNYIFVHHFTFLYIFLFYIIFILPPFIKHNHKLPIQIIY